MEDILARLRRQDRNRQLVAIGVLIVLIGCVVAPSAFETPASEPRHLVVRLEPSVARYQYVSHRRAPAEQPEATVEQD